MNPIENYSPPIVTTYEIDQLAEQLGAARAFSESPEDKLFGSDS